MLTALLLLLLLLCPCSPIRLGPNYLQLPVNAPQCAHHNNHHDGFMNFMHR
jgi:catalase